MLEMMKLTRSSAAICSRQRDETTIVFRARVSHGTKGLGAGG